MIKPSLFPCRPVTWRNEEKSVVVYNVAFARNIAPGSSWCPRVLGLYNRHRGLHALAYGQLLRIGIYLCVGITVYLIMARSQESVALRRKRRRHGMFPTINSPNNWPVPGRRGIAQKWVECRPEYESLHCYREVIPIRLLAIAIVGEAAIVFSNVCPPCSIIHSLCLFVCQSVCPRAKKTKEKLLTVTSNPYHSDLSLIHIWRCRRRG